MLTLCYQVFHHWKLSPRLILCGTWARGELGTYIRSGRCVGSAHIMQQFCPWAMGHGCGWLTPNERRLAGNQRVLQLKRKKARAWFYQNPSWCWLSHLICLTLHSSSPQNGNNKDIMPCKFKLQAFCCKENNGTYFHSMSTTGTSL